MNISDFELFEKELFEQLKKNSKKSLKVIDKNSKLVDFFLNSGDQATVVKFVNDFNDVVLDKKIKNYKYFEEVLKHGLFTNVLAYFRESDVLIRACQDVKRCYVSYEFQDHYEVINNNVLKWLLTMNINYEVQDEKGMTALMYAVKAVKMKFVVKELIKQEYLAYQLDNEGNSVLFHAAESFFSLEKFLKYKNMYDVNHVNNNNENILTYCSRLGRITSEEYFNMLMKVNCIDGNVVNTDGKTAAMYLSELGRYKELELFIEHYKIDPNFVSKPGHSLVSVMIKKYYNYYAVKTAEVDEGFGLTLKYFKRYFVTLRYLAELGCDFKRPVDEDGTTVVMILAKLHDEETAKYLLDKGCVDYLIDSNIKNNYPEIDITTPLVQKNVKTVQMWAHEALYPEELSMIDTHKTGLILYSLLRS